MTHDNLDEAIRAVDPIDAAELATAWSRSATAGTLRNGIADEDIAQGDLTTVPPRRSRRRRTTAIAIAVTAIVAATGWTSYKVLTADTTEGFGCRMPDGSAAVIDLQSGDYAQDCAAMWQHQGDTAPPLVAYQRPSTDGSVVEVVPATEDVPSSWVVVNGDAVDTTLIELESSLDDYVDGLLATCHDKDSAATFIRSEFDRLGLTDWSIRTRSPLGGGEGECAWAFVDAGQQTVEIRPDDRPDEPADAYSWLTLAVALRDELGGRCMDVDDAETVARDLADRIDADRDGKPYRDAPLSEGLLVTSIIDDESSCTTADLNVYGMANLKLRGPASRR